MLELRLYVAGNAPNSVRAIANAHAICDAPFAARHHLEIVDMLTCPQRALADGVLVTPTLLRLLPLPVQRVIGSLTDTEQVLLALSPAHAGRPPGSRSDHVRVSHVIHAETTQVDELPEDDAPLNAPTFLAVGD